MHRRKWLLFGLILLFSVIVVAGCGGNNDEEQPDPNPQNGNNQGEALDINALTAQWADSSHSNILLSPAQRDNCVVCHDGGAFAMNQTEIAELERDFFISIDCRACHTGQGVELMEAGTVTLPTAENVDGGLGALCMSCHNSRKVPNIDDEGRSAPHYSSQADIASGTGGIRIEGFEYGNTSAHVNIDDTCIGCHMMETEEGFASHTFKVDSIEDACSQCHQDITDANLEAGGDYDGDGNTEGFQTEVEGLLALLSETIATELDGGTFESGQGAVIFKDASGTEMDEVPNELYQAGYNHLLVSNDGSLGIHNPTLTVQLLQQSYKALTGEDVPGAEMK
ncbi:MAG: ammonia-forming cytochrome c nitrite reductase subunit c552 [Firmicutes bacterium]|nr:ammonia-forming cytochrome c nitrite reductase subunit c552 [Bacillota bacterium]